MDVLRITHRDVVVACELAGGEAASRLAAWSELRVAYGRGTELVEGGARLWLDRDGLGSALVLARAEAGCCAFLDIEVAVDGDQAWIDLTAPTPEGAAVARALAGLDSARA